jgi:pantothenate kinase-related protein Tda10
MSILTKLPYSLALLATVAFTAAPAHAQFEGAGNQFAQFAPMMEQFAPMMQRMTNKIGKKRMGQMMQMVAPMMASMMPPGGDMSGMENVVSMIGDGPTRRVGRRHK